MNDYDRLEVIDREGWRKEYSLQKTLLHIGSDARNDIILEVERGAGVAPLHAQLISLANGGGLGYRLVNLGNTDILLGASGDQPLPPRSAIEIADGQMFRLGEYTLVIHSHSAPSGSLAANSGTQIGLSLALPHTRLAPHQPLRGMVIVCNLGDRTGVKFDLELEGLDSDCYEIEPGPLLASGAEKEVSFQLFHWGNRPLAGNRSITIYATAPHAYPAERASVSQMIQVLPFYRHQLRLLSPDQAKNIQPAPVSEKPVAPAKTETRPLAAFRPVPEAEADQARAGENWWTAETESQTPARAQATRDAKVEA
ncbi:MAG: hypothetical protein HYR94_14360, partial [Chloroflexi bacterium]|nr:hypothetical protein [Chloroflexota bacterium]